MPTITSKLEAPNTYVDFSDVKDTTKHGKCPTVTVSPGANDITDKQLAVLRKVPAYVAHVEGGYIVEGQAEAEAAAKAQAEAEAAAKAQAEAEAAAQQMEEAAKLAAAKKGGK